MASARSGRCRCRCGTRSWRWGGGGFDRVVDRLDARLLAVRRMHGSGGRFRSFRRIDPLLLRPHGRGRARSRRSRSLVGSGGSGRHVGELVSSFGAATAHLCCPLSQKFVVHSSKSYQYTAEPPRYARKASRRCSRPRWRGSAARALGAATSRASSSARRRRGCLHTAPYLRRSGATACPLPAPHASEGGARGDGRRERLSIKTMASMLGTPREDPSIVTK